ncbi:hypothetical protein [Xanthomonas hortorum]|uniref:hypothetical protein n=1 Tax=Xanthomonas hortorum TaxID=56454 RepID=UPI00204478E3|nr:hypothetical protein [Xanthomonas hortorum]MCM5598658.1 hypothetical protein [Xanthomonas hortorum pv. pelargonii]MCM5660312.1 hypothetical protein [Xanthomonas hortorum pv. pelargonii]MDC8633820.1 hypothetical protein [Xanthomonas hortorum pv. pelargonii]
MSDTLMASRNLVVFNLIFLSESPNGGKQRNASASEVMRARIDCDIVGERIKLHSQTGKRPGEERSEKRCQPDVKTMLTKVKAPFRNALNRCVEAPKECARHGKTALMHLHDL